MKSEIETKKSWKPRRPVVEVVYFTGLRGPISYKKESPKDFPFLAAEPPTSQGPFPISFTEVKKRNPARHKFPSKYSDFPYAKVLENGKLRRENAYRYRPMQSLVFKSRIRSFQLVSQARAR